MGSWSAVTYFALSLPNRPGELARFAKQLEEKKINLLGLWGYADGPEPRLSLVPEKPGKFRRFANAAGIELEEGRTFHRTGRDRPGALAKSLRKIAEAGINVEAIETVAAGKGYGCFIWADEQHWADLEKILE